MYLFITHFGSVPQRKEGLFRIIYPHCSVYPFHTKRLIQIHENSDTTLVAQEHKPHNHDCYSHYGELVSTQWAVTCDIFKTTKALWLVGTAPVVIGAGQTACHQSPLRQLNSALPFSSAGFIFGTGGEMGYICSHVQQLTARVSPRKTGFILQNDWYIKRLDACTN
jgi:hypothetical protein